MPDEIWLPETIGYADLNGPRPMTVPKMVWEWAREYAQHKAICHEFFEGRADTVIEQAKILAEHTEAGAIGSLDICMQVEAEFPGRIEEFVSKSEEHPQGRLIGLMQYISYIRQHG
jgi:hypothetical protein